MKGSLFSEENLADFPDGLRLHTLVMELEKLVESQKTRLDLLEEEATYFRLNYSSISKEYERIKGQFENLAQKMAKQDEQLATQADMVRHSSKTSMGMKPPRMAKMASFNGMPEKKSLKELAGYNQDNFGATGTSDSRNQTNISQTKANTSGSGRAGSSFR